MGELGSAGAEGLRKDRQRNAVGTPLRGESPGLLRRSAAAARGAPGIARR